MKIFRYIKNKINKFIEIWKHEYRKQLALARDYFNINDPYFIRAYADYHTSNYTGTTQELI